MFANKNGNETTIVMGLVIFIVIVIMYNKSRNVPCDKYITHFDKMYYDLPIINTKYNQSDIVEPLYDMNTMKYTINRNKIKQVSDSVKSKWASFGSQNGSDNMGRREDSFSNRQSVPSLRGVSKKLSGPTKRSTHTERFADDDHVDTNFSYNQKYGGGSSLNSGYIVGDDYSVGDEYAADLKTLRTRRKPLANKKT